MRQTPKSLKKALQCLAFFRVKVRKFVCAKSKKRADRFWRNVVEARLLRVIKS